MATPETHPNYRPPAEVPCILLENEAAGFASKRQELEPNRGVVSNKFNSGGASPFVVSNLLSPGECDQLIQMVESKEVDHLQKVDWEYDPSYRDCHRAVLKCPELVSALYRRLLPLLTTAECESVRPYGFDGGDFGEWRPLKLNSVLRISRYDMGGHFSPHKDGAFVENDHVRSVYTVLLYLNEPPAFSGGNTDIHVSASTAGGNEDVISLVPRTGSALVMLHDTLHAGQKVTSGHKYICRLDIMFHRLGGGMTGAELDMIPARVEAERLYASSIVKQRKGDPQGSTMDYLEAQKLQAKLPSSCSTSPTDTHQLCKDVDIGKGSHLAKLNDELIMLCLRFLEPNEVCRVSLASKWFRAICSNSLLWREFFLLRWPALARPESIVKSDSPEADSGDIGIPLAIHEPAADRWGRRPKKKFALVYATVLQSAPKQYGDDRKTMNRMYKYVRNNTSSLPSGYMFSSLVMANFGMEVRKDFRGWRPLNVIVNEGAIQFHKGEGDSENNDIPSRVPLLAETKIWFGSDNYEETKYSWLRIDACIVKIQGGKYLAICTENPLTAKPKGTPYSYIAGFRGIFDDIARVIVARQTEQALRHQDGSRGLTADAVAVHCDAKTKQWKTAYFRRHLAERFFDVVTIDVGSRYTKFTSSGANLNSLLGHSKSWAGWWYSGPHHGSLQSVTEFFVEAAQRHQPKYLLNDVFSSFLSENRNIYTTQQIKFVGALARMGIADELIDASKNDGDLVLPRVLLEAQSGCGSIMSLVQKGMGHLWSAGHGMQNHIVGEQCLRTNGGESQAPFASGEPNMKAIGIIMAHVVEDCFVHRPVRSDAIRRTCAEHPINIVEPASGFSEKDRMGLIQTLTTWNVPYVGFVNGAVAALMSGKDPTRNGIVVMLGGINSEVVVVTEGVVTKQMPLSSCSVDDNWFNEEGAAKEVASAIVEMGKHVDGGSTGTHRVLMTGGRATDRIVELFRRQIAKETRHLCVAVASHEEERHLDAVRGAHILANLSDGRKHFCCIMNLMWSVQVAPPPKPE